MIAIIAGGRDFKWTPAHMLWLEKLDKEHGFTEIVSGCAQGADRAGLMYASAYRIPVTRFPAQWSCHGRSAGPLRNEEMACYADACVLFPGGAGTADMRKRAISHGLKLFEWAETQ